ncbi:redoxin family protein [Ferruginibacter paludis]|uniref:redoxin family protein n=1 Tax=Ferruginibacter paludis TaxID=1310417 RepID=UPI0025B56A4F|nr:redoxin family protein [Ferruginibacter paludis]MDN3655564.1 redoxin family protein [Ferruginibacter paludis]
MLTRPLTILCLIFTTYSLHAQLTKDSLTIFNQVGSCDLTDISLQKNTVIHLDDKALSLFIFLSPECPLCQNYTKTINQLHEQFKDRVAVYGIVSGNAYSSKDVMAFQNKYLTTFNILIDTKLSLTRYLNATVTPQAILLDNKGNLIYTGAIDDWVQGLGKKKILASKHYVKNAIEQSLQPADVTIKKTKAYGCRINDY